MGHHNRHFAGDPYAASGFWGVPSSTANFCEEDYAVTRYIAEWINTLTNLAYVYYAVRYPSRVTSSAAIDPVQRTSHPHWTQPDLYAAALWVLGVLSLVFHATLRHDTQYGDELAMLVLAGVLLRGALMAGSGAKNGSSRHVIASSLAAAVTIAAAAIYLRTGAILHQVYAFLAMLLVVGLRTIQLMRRQHQPHRARVIRLFYSACAVLALAYTLWHVDLELCASLRALRHRIGLPWAWLLEMHGWWHVLTALGASIYIRLLRELDV